jgi:hypothetical protein
MIQAPGVVFTTLQFLHKLQMDPLSWSVNYMRLEKRATEKHSSFFVSYEENKAILNFLFNLQMGHISLSGKPFEPLVMLHYSLFCTNVRHCLSICMSICLPACLPTCLPAYLPIYQPTHLPTYLPKYLPT